MITRLGQNVCISNKMHFSGLRKESLYLQTIAEKIFCRRMSSERPTGSTVDLESPKEIYKISTDASKGECTLQLTSFIPRKVWAKVHEIFLSNDFSWSPVDHSWTSPSTGIAENALQEVKQYIDETRSDFKDLNSQEKKDNMTKWIAMEEAFIASNHREAHESVVDIISTPLKPPLPEQSEKDTLLALFSQLKGEVEKVLPSQVDKARFLLLLENTLEKIEKLSELEPESIRKAVLLAAALGLEPGQVTQRCYFVPFEKTLVFVLGYRGLIELSMRTRETLFYDAKCVYKQDRFEVKEPPHQEINHSPHPIAEERGEITQFYAMRAMKNGEIDIYVLNFDELKKFKRVAGELKNSKSIWFSWTEEMGLKTAVKSLAKTTELAVEDNIKPPP